MKVKELWSKVKKAVLSDQSVASQPELKTTWERIFKTFDQNLPKHVKKVEAAAKTAGKKETPKSRQDYKTAMMNLRKEPSEQCRILPRPALRAG